MKDEDIYAFNPVPPPVAPPARQPRRVWPWVMAGLAALLLVALVSGGMVLLSWLGGAHEGLHISIDGEDWQPGWADGVAGLLAVCGVGLGLLVALLASFLTVGLVVPLTLLLVVLGLALGAGGVVLAVALVVALVLSPLWALALLLWLVLRPRRKARMQA
jgi:hypothetical protein